MLQLIMLLKPTPIIPMQGFAMIDRDARSFRYYETWRNEL